MNPPELPDIHLVLEQLDSAVEHVPDWLWQGLAVWAASKGIEWTWKHRQEIVTKLLRPIPPTQTIYAGSIHSEEAFGEATVTVGSEIQALWDVRSTVGSERQLLWNVEASTLPERLLSEGLELLSWYLRHR